MRNCSWSPATAQEQLQLLIRNGKVQHNADTICCCVRSFVTFPNDSHKYFYNPNKQLSRILSHEISNHLYTMPPKSPNSNTQTTDRLNVQLELEPNIDPERDRTWVNIDQFPEFESDYQDSQDNSSLAEPLNVEFQWHIVLKDVDTNEINIADPWVSLSPVYAGMNGVQLCTTHKTMERVYHYEDSRFQIASMSITQLHIPKTKQHARAFRIQKCVVHCLIIMVLDYKPPKATY
jgi:hypothetical protein